MLDVAVDDDLEVFEKGIVAQRIDVVYVEEELCKVGQCMFFGVVPTELDGTSADLEPMLKRNHVEMRFDGVLGST